MRMPSQDKLEKYAELALRTGVNLQEQQKLMINSTIEGAEFTRVVAKKAFEMGAEDVHINWSDDELTRMKYEYASQETLSEVPEWQQQKFTYFAEQGAAILSIRSTDPDLLKGIDAGKVAAANKARSEAMSTFRNYTMNDRLQWSIVSIPIPAWAQKIFPGESEETAQDKLWEQIFSIVRVDQKDPIAAWEEHNETLIKARGYLNKKQYSKLVYKAPGTDLEVALPKGHIWKGGPATTEKENIQFNPNMPTEEVFTAPHKYGVDGKVTCTKPLNYGGNVIDGFTLTFKEGKVTDFSAEEGEETLKHLLDTDEGSRRLGELALVPHESPISQSGLIFYNTLYDENASCHLALGKAYPNNMTGGSDMSEEELDQNGINHSLSHVDFMMGSDKLDIDGIMEDGTKEAVMRQGSWAISFE
ncbi:aminopeptidase [Halobacillus halophilus]|uniref:M29 family aminopeptidase n=1 Tax=Halobacillus halophilus (strain ATCC 35676 / DSM 2266 / JCM 20832 / KCTC 3685 / LMG 17431 / NBRC 102448 / NCIMB 2269) TaxID=866895 RepID=I0JSI4_HALH3|nr:aminopeptidase [Halobacillus halophilus]ASF41043.1 aminopeptidase [Halobacillus halophilus]CCG47106.1 M29 family aminopeptidase [Halobacillus halophilus DSM 2266]